MKNKKTQAARVIRGILLYVLYYHHVTQRRHYATNRNLISVRISCWVVGGVGRAIVLLISNIPISIQRVGTL